MTTDEINRRAKRLGSRFKVVEYGGYHLQVIGPSCVYEFDALERETNVTELLFFFRYKGYDLQRQRRMGDAS